MIYLDNQATTACDPRVVQTMLPWFTRSFANPHSAEHLMGQEAADAVEAARRELALLLHADPRELVFTSGATESNNMAIKGAARHAVRIGDPRRRIVTLATEHPCVLESVRDLAHEGFDPVVLPVEPDGCVALDRLRQALEVPTLLVSIMAVNNETGIIHDLGRLAPLVRGAGALLHSDLAQAVGKIPLDVRTLDLDLASISAHKFYGPKGVGALYVRRRPRVRLQALFSGGGQERGLRSGTLPVPLLVGLGEAARLARLEMNDEATRLRSLRDRLLARLQVLVPGILVNGPDAPRIPGSLSLRFPERSALAVMADMPELCVSTGSACSAAEIAPSHVLVAMGLTVAEASRSLRLAIGRTTSADELDRVAEMLACADAGRAELAPPAREVGA